MPFFHVMRQAPRQTSRPQNCPHMFLFEVRLTVCGDNKPEPMEARIPGRPVACSQSIVQE